MRSSLETRNQSVYNGVLDDGPGPLVALKSRLRRFARGRDRALGMAAWLRSLAQSETRHVFECAGDRSRAFAGVALRFDRLTGMARDLEECNTYQVYREYLETGQVRLVAAHSCKRDRLCPVCAAVRGGKYVHRYYERFEAVRPEVEAQGLHPFLVTLTIANGPDLGERFEHLTSNVRRLWADRRKAVSTSSRNLGHVLCDAAGGVWSFEIKRGNGSGLWHPHCHALLLLPLSWRSNIELVDGRLRVPRSEAYWSRITGDSRVVHAKPVGLEGEGVEGAWCEVFKYALKFSGMEYADNWHAHEVVRGRRLLGSMGILRGVPDTTDEDLLDGYLDEDAGRFIDRFFEHDPEAGCYREVAHVAGGDTRSDPGAGSCHQEKKGGS